MVPVDKPLLYSVLTDIHSSYVMDNGRVQEYTIFLHFDKNFAHARAKCTRLSFLSGCDRKQRTPRKETGYEATVTTVKTVKTNYLKCKFFIMYTAAILSKAHARCNYWYTIP